MLHVTVFVAIAGICSITLALLYSILFRGIATRAADVPWLFVAAGIILAIIGFWYHKKKTGRWPGDYQPPPDPPTS